MFWYGWICCVAHRDVGALDSETESFKNGGILGLAHGRLHVFRSRFLQEFDSGSDESACSPGFVRTREQISDDSVRWFGRLTGSQDDVPG